MLKLWCNYCVCCCCLLLLLLQLRRYADYAVVAYNVANAVACVVLLPTPASRRDAHHGAHAVADAVAGAVVIAEDKNHCMLLPLTTKTQTLLNIVQMSWF